MYPVEGISFQELVHFANERKENRGYNPGKSLEFAQNTANYFYLLPLKGLQDDLGMDSTPFFLVFSENKVEDVEEEMFKEDCFSVGAFSKDEILQIVKQDEILKEIFIQYGI